MAPPAGLLALYLAAFVDTISVITYWSAPVGCGDLPLKSPWRWSDRLDYLGSVFDFEVLTVLRLSFVTALVLTSVGAWCPKGGLVAWSSVNTVLGLVAFGGVLGRYLTGDLRLKPFLAATALCTLGILSSRCFRAAVDYVRSNREPPEVDVWLYAGERFHALARALQQHPFMSRRGGEQKKENRGLLDEEEAEEEPQQLLAGLHSALRKFADRSASIRSFWSAQLARELSRARSLAMFAPNLGRRQSSTNDEAFGLLLRLFAHEDVLDELHAAFLADPATLVFYSVQLATFALFGAYWDGPRLRDMILALCATNLHFAHRVDWYIRAFAATMRLTPAASTAVDKFQQDVRTAASSEDEEDGRFLETPMFLDALIALSRELRNVERPEREAALRRGLDDVNAKFLPSRGSLPFLREIGNDERVVKVHSVESSVFSTKERCPFLACVEVEAQGGFFELEEPPRTPKQPKVGFCVRTPRKSEDVPATSSEEEDDSAVLGQWRSGDKSTASPSVSPPTLYGATLRSRAPEEVELSERPTVVFKERWAQKETRVLGTTWHSTTDDDDDAASPIETYPQRRRRLVPVIVKACDDLRQEQFASQLIAEMAAILKAANVPVWLRPYDIVATGPDCGVIEAIPDTVSLDALRRNDPDFTTLLDFFTRHFSGRDQLAAARLNFVESLAPACILCYLLQLKDRHNGNVLLDARGRVTHIDFGYMFASSPGGNLGFEAAPFKLTADFVEVIGDENKRKFEDLCLRAFLALRRQRHRLILLAEMTMTACAHLPCFDGRPRETIDAFHQRFRPDLAQRHCAAFVRSLIDQSINNWRTSLYDYFQLRFVGIA